MPSESTFKAPEGVLLCDGVIDGVQVSSSRPGTISFIGGTEDTWCGAGSGWVDYKGLVYSTNGKKLRVTGSGDWNRVGLTMSFFGDLNDNPMDGPIAAEPKNGNCDLDKPITPEDEGEPVTEVTLRGAFIAHD